MKHEVIWAIAAKKDLDRLPGLIAKRIVAKVHQYCVNPTPLKFAKSLTGNLKGYYRFRVGKYRVIFEKEAHNQAVLLLVLVVEKRDDVYF